MQEMLGVARGPGSGAVIAVALGDAPNDIAMLEQADFGIIMPNPAHAGLPALAGEAQGRIMRAQTAGPAGWSMPRWCATVRMCSAMRSFTLPVMLRFSDLA